MNSIRPQVSSVTGTRSVAAIHGLFFLSGMGALVFENVWFSQTGLIVGNSVWSAALVMGAFMAGLALGNGLAVVLARRWVNLVRGYAAVEFAAAVSGALLVLAFPWLLAVFRPLLSHFVDQASVLNFVRMAIAFSMMVIPATALGTTLPMLARPLESVTGSYGCALGRLYGVNTLGAVAGTLLSELVLIPDLGLRGSGLVGAVCNLTAGFIALRIAASPLFDAVPHPAQARGAAPLTGGRRVVAAAFLSGGILLALEVIWFRFLLMFQVGTSLIFAINLAVVLSSMALGAVLASTLARRGWLTAGVARLSAAGAAVGLVAGYAQFDAVLGILVRLETDSILPTALLSVVLMGPASLFSGMLFTALGEQLRSHIAHATAATGVLTLANTLGAMAGSLLAAFIMLPALGMERSFFLLAVLYALSVFLIPSGERVVWRRGAPVLAAALALALFPFGRMAGVHYRNVEASWDARLIAAREGMAETAFYLQHEFLGEPHYLRLVTNSISMSTTATDAQRYQKLFAYLPAAFHAGIADALVICFGVGSTASAVADLPDVKRIDVVDVSRNIIEMSDLVYPDPRRHPLRDSRVAVHVEDGRFFLQHTNRRYDLITGEPPPPKIAGVASLYSLEYFQLLRDHLNPGGMASYWLPVHSLRPGDTLAIMRAFCDAFEDCSLWSGIGLEWMLVGTRGGIAPVSRERYSRLWSDPRTGPVLRKIGIDGPEQMVALFMADANVLRGVTAHAAPVEDDHPRRISTQLPTRRAEPFFAWFMDDGRSRERAEKSAWLAGILPQSLVASSGKHFRERGMLDAALYPELRTPDSSLWNDLAEVLGHTDQRALPELMLGSEARTGEIANGKDGADPLAAEYQVLDALVRRRPPAAGLTPAGFGTMTQRGQLLTIFHRCLAGRNDQARSLMALIPIEQRAMEPYRSLFSWAAIACPAKQRS